MDKKGRLGTLQNTELTGAEVAMVAPAGTGNHFVADASVYCVQKFWEDEHKAWQRSFLCVN